LNQLKTKFEGLFGQLDKKIENVNTFAERVFGGLSEELVKVSHKTNNKSEQLEWNQLNAKLDESLNSYSRAMQFLSQLNSNTSYVLECLRLIMALLAADEHDRESFGLYGLKSNLVGDFKSDDSKLSLKLLSEKNSSTAIIYDSNKSFLPEIGEKPNRSSNNIHNNINNNMMNNYSNNSSKERSHLVSNSVHVTPLKGNKFSNFSSNANIKQEINLELSNKCMSCSGSKALVNQAFKLACLN